MARDHHALIGRTDALASISSAATSQTGAKVVLVSGEAGIGKSHLLTHIVDEQRARGRHILFGRCVEVSDEPIPYAPVSGLLRTLRRELDDDADETLVATVDAMLGVGSDQPRNLAEFFETVLSIVQRLADAGPVLVAMEDLHWADPGTLDLISFLFRHIDGDVLILLTFRAEDPHNAALAPLEASLLRSGAATRVTLERLGRDELAELSRIMTGNTHTGAHLDRLVERSQGNPFIAGELLVAGSDEEIPAKLQDILLARAAQIDADAEHLVRVTALLGRPVGHDLLAAASGFDDDHLAKAVRQTVGSGLVLVDREREEYAFRHVLTRDAVRDRLLPAEARRIHKAIAAALQRDPEVRSSAGRSAEWAAHVDASGDKPAAAAARLVAARLAAEVYAYDAAWSQYLRIVELIDAIDEDVPGAPRATVLAEAADAARWSGRLDTAVELAERATEHSATDAERAVLAERIGRYLVEAGRLDEAAATFAKAADLLADTDDPMLRARIAVSSARLLMINGQHAEAIREATGALALARDAGAPGEQGRAHTALGMSLVLTGEVDAGLAHVREGNELVHAWCDLEDCRRADSNLSFALLVAGHTREACEVGVAGLDTMRRYGLATANGGALTSNTIVLLRVSGRWVEADELCDELESQGLPQGMAQRIALNRTELEVARGRYDRARTFLDAAYRLAGALPSPEIAADLYLAEAFIAAGRGDLASATEQVGFALDLHDDENPRAVVRSCLLALQVEAELADLHRSTKHDAEAAPRVTRLHERYLATCSANPSPEIHAYAMTADGEYHRATRRASPDIWTSAAERWERLERPRGLAYCLMRRGEAELLRRRVAAGRRSLARAHRIASELGCAPIVAGVETIATRGRVHLDEIAVEQRRSDDRPALTGREAQVLREIAAGLSNKQIAERLDVSPRTVGVHVSNVLSKLHVHTRAQAVHAAAGSGLLD